MYRPATARSRLPSSRCRRPSSPRPQRSPASSASPALPPSVGGGARRPEPQREHPDGEALAWAHNRLRARSEQRRILMVISDGAPVDDSTLFVNPGNYLEKHLREVIHDVERLGEVELTAIGIGHDVTRYYRRAVTIVDAEQLGGVMLERLAELFDEDRGANTRVRSRRAA